MKRRSSVARVSAWVAACACLLSPALASAYCRTTSCPDKPGGTWQTCDPPAADDCGKPLFWARQCVGYTLQKDASSQVSLEKAEPIFEQAFQAWQNADCGGGKTPSIAIEYQGPVTCDAQEYNKELGNANVIIFRDESWPYMGTSSTLALTTVTFHKDTAEIYDADMEINSANVTLSTGTPITFDLLSIATHEAGHFLGMAHNTDIQQTTMYPDYKGGDDSLRSLEPDDMAGICAIYKPDEPNSDTCDATPRHGFADLCGDDQPVGGCSTAPAPASSAFPTLLLAALAAGAAHARRRRA